MPGISGDSIEKFRDRLNHFPQRYIDDWREWISIAPSDPNRPAKFGVILRKWQACRPNEMRREMAAAAHPPPYLEALIDTAALPLSRLQDFEMSGKTSFGPEKTDGLKELWKIFRDLATDGKANKGKAGAVGISKAVLLLSYGKVGPAFDDEVRTNLGIGPINNADQWIDALKKAHQDVRGFERKNDTTLRCAAPTVFSGLPAGRIYDMALGPRL